MDLSPVRTTWRWAWLSGGPRTPPFLLSGPDGSPSPKLMAPWSVSRLSVRTRTTWSCGSSMCFRSIRARESARRWWSRSWLRPRVCTSRSGFPTSRATPWQRPSTGVRGLSKSAVSPAATPSLKASGCSSSSTPRSSDEWTPGRSQARCGAQARNSQTVREIEQSILMRAPEHDLEPSLHRIAAVMELLGDPQHAFPVIHVTGTNGKTSTTRMIERMLREMGLSTGRFTSPHLHNIRERIALNGEAIDAERFTASYEDVLPFLSLVDARSAAEGGPQMTYFEVLVAVAYASFADAPIDVAVVEVGMGGSWDATNVVNAQVAVVTPIALDHERFLGSSLEGIAIEKAGIFKAGSLVVSAMQEPEVAEILVGLAQKLGTSLAFEGNEFGILSREVAVGGQQLAVRGLGGDYDDLFLPLHG